MMRPLLVFTLMMAAGALATDADPGSLLRI